jgi:hypothetical protein
MTLTVTVNSTQYVFEGTYQAMAFAIAQQMSNEQAA